MPLTKQPVAINFSKGLNLKSDPKQVQLGNFLALENSQFGTEGLLQKRNGFGDLEAIVDTNISAATTFTGALVSIGDHFNVLSQDNGHWYNKGSFPRLGLDTTPAVRSNSSQLTVDSTFASNNLTCTTWYDSNTFSYYKITDGETGDIIVNTTLLTASASATVGPKVFYLGNYFVILYWKTVTGNAHLHYVAIPVSSPDAPLTPVDTGLIGVNAGGGANIATAFDAYSTGNLLYCAIATTGGAVSIFTLSATLALSATTNIAAANADSIAVTFDPSPISFRTSLWVAWYNRTATTVQVVAATPVLTLVSNKEDIVGTTVLGTGRPFTVSVVNGKIRTFFDSEESMSYTPTTPYDSAYVYRTIIGGNRQLTGMTGSNLDTTALPFNFYRGVGLASKVVYYPANEKIYLLATYTSRMQPCYFLLDASATDAVNEAYSYPIARLAYGNGSGYASSTSLPQLLVKDTTIVTGYLYKSLVQATNKETNLPTGTQIAGLYSQTGINIVSFNLDPPGTPTAELGGSLQLSGGFLWQYDGDKPVEQNFLLYPDNIGVATGAAGGTMGAGTYYYVATYEWTDAQGYIHRSAPSVPVAIVKAAPNVLTTVSVPYLQQTYKRGNNPARLVIYRWSLAQQVYYQITSLPVPSPNVIDTITINLTYSDGASDSSILGNNILYTTGGVVENIAPPAVKTMVPFKTRLFTLDAESSNQLFFSKQVIQGTPVEMSDFFSIYVNPTTGAQGPTGDLQCITVMDDKLILFKQDAIYYITGNGPNNTGADNDFSDPIFISSTVGCDNQRSIVFMPNGIMFQSDKGIWLLGRDLSTQYIGAPVESYNNDTVVSALAIPGTNQVRFMLESGVCLMYDYYYNQWGTFNGMPGLAATLYLGLHTYINQYGDVRMETPGRYLDGTTPVTMAFTTSWMNLAGLQGYERAYFFYLLGTYLSPHKLNITIGFDYDSTAQQTVSITPDNYNPAYGLPSGEPYGGGTPYGGNSKLEQWRIFFEQQRCQAFQISIKEVYDPTYGSLAGPGLTLSGLNLIIGAKKGWKPIASANSAG